MTPLLQPILASTGSAPDSAETNEARHTVDMISELKHYFLEHKRSVNTIVMLQSVSADLRKFITGSSAMPVAGPIKRKP
jgi:hypothetical protein